MGLTGKLAPGLGSAEDGAVIVTLLPPEEYGGRGTIDREYDDLYEMLESGKLVKAYFASNPEIGYSCTVRWYEREGIVFTFLSPLVTHSVITGYAIYGVVITNDGTWGDYSFFING